jgi:hypothetical protein
MYFRLPFVSLTAALAFGAPPPPSTKHAPFIETFQRDGKTLIYVLAVHHSSLLFPDALTDPVFKTVQSVFTRSSPDAVIVEGVDPSQLSGFLDYSKRCAAVNYNMPGKPCDESAFAAHSATESGAPVYTGEPSAPALLAFFEAQGYSIHDYLAFWIMNNIPQEKRDGQLGEDNFRQLVDHVVANENHLLGTSTRFTAEDFAVWYAKNMQVPRSYLDIAREDANPYPPPEGTKTVFHTLSALSARARDENVVTTIKVALQNHKRVLVVYGASHLVFEWKKLVQLMGSPKRSKPF